MSTTHKGTTAPLTSRDHRLYRQTTDALIDLLSRPGWVEAILATPDDVSDEQAVSRMRLLIIRLFRTVIEREGHLLAARLRRERDQRGRVRLVRGRRVRSPLHARQRGAPSLTPPRAD